ncbi:MAG: DUF1990 family protein, partial [Micromonosporaceae bacterium]
MSGFTYPEVGATSGDRLPAGYRHLRYRALIGPGDLGRAADAVLSWRLHRAAGVRVEASA